MQEETLMLSAVVEATVVGADEEAVADTVEVEEGKELSVSAAICASRVWSSAYRDWMRDAVEGVVLVAMTVVEAVMLMAVLVAVETISTGNTSGIGRPRVGRERPTSGVDRCAVVVAVAAKE